MPPTNKAGKSDALVAAVDEHQGLVRVDDSEWSARGGPAEAGERVKVTGSTATA